MNSNSNYIQSLKATSLFGGVQLYSVLIMMISSKFVAVLLGPEGMGLSGLLSSTIGFISTATALGLGVSAVKDVSSSYSTGDSHLFNLTVNVFRRLVWVTGGLGMAVCLLLSPLWSNITFGNSEYTISFAVLSVTLLLGQISSGQGVVLQGTRRFKDMAKSRILGQTLGLFVTLPLYFLLGLDGIVPAMLLSSILGLSLTFYFSRKVKVEKIKLQLSVVYEKGKQMVQMGFLIAMQGFVSLLVMYLVRIYISHAGGLGEVGLYNSGFGMVETSVGMVFAAISAEYYPRLSSCANNTKDFSQAINQQINLTLLLITPIVILFLLLGRYAIIILLSDRFLVITTMIQILVISMFLKAPGWCYGYAFLAKSDSKAVWLNEATTELIKLVSFIIGYHYFGLNGVAVAFFLMYVYYTTITGYLCKRRYSYLFDNSLLQTHFPLFASLILVFVCINVISGALGNVLAVIIAVLTIWQCYVQLNKIINIKVAIASLKNKILK